VLETLSTLEERDVILELPVVFPRHFGDVLVLAEQFARLRIVIDHLGKPPLGRDDVSGWERDLRAAAAYPNVRAKVSGLNTAIERSDWRVDDLLPACAVALDSLGPERLMCGSDWPVALLNGDYERVWEATRRLVEELAPGEQAGLVGDNAARVYGIATPETTTAYLEEGAWQSR